VEEIAEHFLELIDKEYSPEGMGVSLATTANKGLFNQKTEVWIGGPCLVVSEKAWRKIVEHYTEEAEE
jgi:GTPase